MEFPFRQCGGSQYTHHADSEETPIFPRPRDLVAAIMRLLHKSLWPKLDLCNGLIIRCANCEKSFVISVCILAKNSESTLLATLSSLSRFQEIILLDTGSTDRTMEIAGSFANVRVFETPFTGFGLLRNQAAALASNDWIFAVDSDEIVTKALDDEISSFSLDGGSLYEIDFHNYFNGRRIFGCGWHPERHIRLYNRKSTRFSDSSLHEGVLTNQLRIVRLKHPIIHTPYRSISDFLAKMQHYSDLFAQEYKGRRSSSFSKALFHGAAAFLRSYIIKRGFLSGSEGFTISMYNANVAFYKYLKLAEANRKKP